MVAATLYQFLLQQYGLESYVLLGPDGDGSRVGLISANREGIVSCVGYLAIYTGWVQIGKWLFKPRYGLQASIRGAASCKVATFRGEGIRCTSVDNLLFSLSAIRRVLKEFLMLLVQLILMFVCLWLATSWSQLHIQPISRRLVNLSYILWMVRTT